MARIIFTRRWSVVLGLWLLVAATPCWGAPNVCSAVRQGNRVELRSPAMVFTLDVSAGLRAVSWENRLTGQRLELADGPELELDFGLPAGPLETPLLRVTQCQLKATPAEAEAVFQLTAARPAVSAQVTYRWDARRPVLRKFAQVTNRGAAEWNRLLNVRLGTYRTPAHASGMGQQGFPLYLDDQFFLTLAHPAGWAVAEKGRLQLRHYPGARVPPGGTFLCMEAVYGVATAAQARAAFLEHLRSRMRRVVRGHDKPYAVFEPFGARPGGSFDETEPFVLDMIGKIAEGQRKTGCRFDFFSVDFWVDYHGDLKGFDPLRFPHGLTNIRRELEKLGTAPGLWIDSSMCLWSIGGNPAVASTCTHDPQQPKPKSPFFCRATEPIKSLYTAAFRHHIRENGVRLLKFDNLCTTCDNPRHEHLPGIYSIEPIQNALIEFLAALDRECPDVFLMLYWGYRSPWWLLHGDTLFDSGIGIEAASPSDQPAPYVRQSITQKLDQAQWHAQDVPVLGKDSLGVWLSDWPWNSQVGKEHWQAGLVMDLCRGSMLAQPWSDTPWLSPPERRQMAELIALLKARPECFGKPRPILGNPSRNEPYGYCCTDGRRAFLAISNGGWKDALLDLELNSAWGLPDGQQWDLYRWHPDPARLERGSNPCGGKVQMALRPFEVVLLEVVPHGQSPSLSRRFAVQSIPLGFHEPSQALDITVTKAVPHDTQEKQPTWTVLEPWRFTSAGGATLQKRPDGSLLAGGKNPPSDTYTISVRTELRGITAFRLEALNDPSLPSRGPGRAVNGNFSVDELRVTAAPRANPTATVPVPLEKPLADFSQAEWPIDAAIDGNPDTGWSIDPEEGFPHAAVFATRQPVGFPNGAELTFTIVQGPREHNLGRWRLLATTAKPLPPASKLFPAAITVLRGQARPSRDGGLLLLSVEMHQNAKPQEVQNIGRYFSCDARLGGVSVPCTPVLGQETYPAAWQAWRIKIDPSTKAQDLEATIAATAVRSLNLSYHAYFLPGRCSADVPVR